MERKEKKRQESIRIRRVHAPPGSDDGFRVLVDRLWPRGITKEKAGVDLWLKEIAPSDELRRWFGHDPQRWPEFRRRYFQELAGHGDLLRQLLQHAENGPVTLLYAARDEQHNNAAALRDYLLGQGGE